MKLLNEKDKYGMTPLHHLMNFSNSTLLLNTQYHSFVDQVLSKGLVDCNVSDIEGDAPLLLATKKQDMKLV